MWKYEREVSYYETDRMGVVHHSNYLRYLEDARIHWLHDFIEDYSEMEKEGVIIPAVSANGHFKNYLRFGDRYSVTVKLVEYTSVRLRVEYEVRNSETDLLCYYGDTVHCFTQEDHGEYRPISLKRKYPKMHEGFMKMLENDKK